MNILIAGCGKVGASLAVELSRQGHDVSIVDAREDMLENLPAGFNGFTTTGLPIDQDVLKRAGIENCDVFAAVTQDDNVNIMASELAKDIFKVPQVFARIYDPKRDDVFSSLGLHTVCPTNLTVSAVCAAISDSTSFKMMTLGKKTVSFNTMNIPREFIGVRVSDIEYEKNEVLYGIVRDGELVLVGLDNHELRKDDILIFTKIVD